MKFLDVFSDDKGHTLKVIEEILFEAASPQKPKLVCYQCKSVLADFTYFWSTNTLTFQKPRITPTTKSYRWLEYVHMLCWYSKECAQWASSLRSVWCGIYHSNLVVVYLDIAMYLLRSVAYSTGLCKCMLWLVDWTM